MRVPAWLSVDEWVEPGMAPGPGRSQPASPPPPPPHKDLGLRQKPHPVTRAHGRERGEAADGREAGTGVQGGGQIGKQAAFSY